MIFNKLFLAALLICAAGTAHGMYTYTQPTYTYVPPVTYTYTYPTYTYPTYTYTYQPPVTTTYYTTYWPTYSTYLDNAYYYDANYDGISLGKTLAITSILALALMAIGGILNS